MPRPDAARRRPVRRRPTAAPVAHRRPATRRVARDIHGWPAPPAGARRGPPRPVRREPAPRPRRAGRPSTARSSGPSAIRTSSVTLRSAVKPFALVALVESGAADDLRLSRTPSWRSWPPRTPARTRTSGPSRRCSGAPASASRCWRAARRDAHRRADRGPAGTRRRGAWPDPPHVLRLPRREPAAEPLRGLVARRTTTSPSIPARSRSGPPWRGSSGRGPATCGRPSTTAAWRPTCSRWSRSRARSRCWPTRPPLPAMARTLDRRRSVHAHPRRDDRRARDGRRHRRGRSTRY